jgi:hypothetical protein
MEWVLKKTYDFLFLLILNASCMQFVFICVSRHKSKAQQEGTAVNEQLTLHHGRDVGKTPGIRMANKQKLIIYTHFVIRPGSIRA